LKFTVYVTNLFSMTLYTNKIIIIILRVYDFRHLGGQSEVVWVSTPNQEYEMYEIL